MSISAIRRVSKKRGRRRAGLTVALALASLSVPAVASAATPASASGAQRAWPLSAAGAAGMHRMMPGLSQRAISSHAGAAFVTADPDPDAFGLDGKVGVHVTATSADLFAGSALAPDGKILASGFGTDDNGSGAQILYVTRRNPDGSPDKKFGGTGVVTVNHLQGEATQIAPLAGGGLIGTGFAVSGDQIDEVVFRLDATGRPAPGFGQNGVVQFPTAGFDFGTNVVVQPDGKIVVVGASSPTADDADLSVRRLLPSGAVDPAFGIHGEVHVNVADFDEATGVALQPDGKIVVVGDTDDTASADDTLALRLTPYGALDRAFGNGGIVRLPAGGAGNVVLQKDGKIDLVATTNDPVDAVIFRLLGNGGPDTSFNGNGRVVMSNEGNDVGFGIGLAPDQGIVITAFQAVRPHVVTDSFLNRVTPDGKLDPRFGTNGTVHVHNAEATFEVGLSIQPDGKIVTTGRRGDFDGNSVVDSIATIDRFKPDGSFDKTTDPGN